MYEHYVLVDTLSKIIYLQFKLSTVFSLSHHITGLESLSQIIRLLYWLYLVVTFDNQSYFSDTVSSISTTPLS